MNTKTTYILGGLALVAGLFLLVAQPWQTKPADGVITNGSSESTVLENAPGTDDVDRLEIIRPGAPKLVFAKADDGTSWRIVEPIDAPAVDFRIRTAIAALTGLKEKRRYAAKDKNRPSDSEAGLGDDAIVATIHDAKANKSHTIRVGRRAPLSSDTYVKITGTDDVLIVEGAIAESVAVPMDDARDKRLLSRIRQNDVKRVQVAGAGGAYELLATDDGNWMIESPVRARADKAKVDGLINAARNLAADRFVEDAPPDLARFALDTPSIAVTLVTQETGAATTSTQPSEVEDTTSTLLIGGRAGENYFAKLSDRPWVFTIPSRVRNDLAKPLDELRDRQLLRFEKENVTGITIDGSGESVTISREGAKWMLDDGAEADLTAVDDLLKSARDLKAVNFVEHETLTDPGLDPPQASVSLTVTGQETPLQLSVGDTTASGEMVYVRNPATGTTAIARLADAANIGRAPAAYRSRDMLSFGKGLADRLDVERDQQHWIIEKAEDEQNWRLTEPVQDDADTVAVDAILSDLYTLRARAVAGIGNPADFGLDAPDVTVSVRYQPLPQPLMDDAALTSADDEATSTQPAEEAEATDSQPASGPTWVEQDPVTHVVRLSEHDGRVYATLDDGDVVYEIDRQILQNLRAELLNRNVAGFDPSEVVGVRFIGSQGTTELNRVGDAWQYADDPLLPLDTRKITTAMKALADLRTEKYYGLDDAELAALGLEEPVLTAEVTLADHRTVRIGISDEGPDDVRGKYAHSSATDRVFVLSPDQLGAFNKSIEDFKIEQK